MGGIGASDEVIAEAQRILDERMAARAAKKAKREAEHKAKWDAYHEQLAKGNSNIGGGAKKARRRRGRALIY